MGSGTISRRGRSWVIRWEKPRDSAGRRQQGFKSVRGSKKEAEHELRRILADQDGGVIHSPSTMTVGQWINEWLQDVVARRVRSNTHRSYESYARTHIVPSVGHVKLSQLQPAHIDHLITKILDSGLTANTARHVYVVLKKALKDAVRRGYIRFNVCDRVDPPIVRHPQIQPPTKVEVSEIITCVENDSFAVAFRLMASTGLRRGEMAGLQWRSVDFDRNVLSVVQTVDRESRGSLRVVAPKTLLSRRGVALDDEVADLLLSERIAQQKRVLESGGAVEDHGWVIPDERGRLIDPDRLTRCWRKAAIAAGHPTVRLHDLRHHQASVLMALGVNPKVVQERLGHSTPSFTLERYSHVAEGLQADAASMYARAT